MALRELVLGVDIGTTATKAVLFDEKGRAVGAAKAAYPYTTPAPGWAEQDPDQVLEGVVSAIREALGRVPAGCRIAGVGFSSQMYSVLAVDGAGRPLTGCLTWMDHRAAREAEEIRRAAGERLYHETGCPVDAIYPLAKIHWLRRQGGLAQARFLSIKEYVTHFLCGEYAADWSCASATGLFALRRCAWSEEALAAAGITARQLSPPVPPRWTFPRWTPAALAATGLSGKETGVIGGGDGPLASLGVGAILPGQVAVNVGTSAAARRVMREPRTDDGGRLWCYVLDEGWWVSGGIVTSGGVVVDWFRHEVGDQAGAAGSDPALSYRALNDAVASVPPGALGLVFIPYLTGEQCPAWNSEVSGAYLGLTLAHRREHLARATLEGVARALARVIEAGARLAGPATEIRLTGGLNQCPAWLEIATNTFGHEVCLPATLEGSAAGAAALAWIALGLWQGVEEAGRTAAVERRVPVQPEMARFYREAGERFEELYEGIRPYLTRRSER
ncbi:MAG: gluconokinase [Betaproteobacteria bacterium]